MAPRKQHMVDEEPSEVNPYEVLGLHVSATANDVKSAYRKAALKHHPDKAPDHLKSTAHSTFQNIALAYAVLSDPQRRRRYDATGSTSKSIADADGFSWSDFYTRQYEDAISSDAIEEFAKQYKGSDEEKSDLMGAYLKYQGRMAKVYTVVMLSLPAEDEGRFRALIDAAIETGDVKAFKAYVSETEEQRQRRIARYDNEKTEAIKYAEELGIADKLYNNGGESAREDSLKSLIQKNQNSRASFLDDLEAKYASRSKTKSKMTKKRLSDEAGAPEEPSKRAFKMDAATVLSKNQEDGEMVSGRKSKRTKC
ncbi:MAG: hypothetical protein M1818_001100 [Claussenomyces sp. TS43310]|nr:MAG: hypothetical protein M1818_001100 [Claussenomyces sp. TS43310]